jgi:hypothetical protein
MKALSIKQPWASLIAAGAKDIENRDWATKHRGMIAIHASARMSQDDMDDACGMMRGMVPKFSQAKFEQDNFPLGAILGIAEIADCVKQSDSPWFVGDFGFVLQFAVKFRNPIPCKGALGLWDVPVEILQRMREEYRLAAPSIAHA